MSPVVFGCVVCGYQIDALIEENEPWLGEFRIVYGSVEGAASVTGVGRYSHHDEGDFTAPPHPANRWDDHDYVPEASDRIAVMLQYSEDGRNGFVLHDACWCLLQKSLGSDTIPLERLFNICGSLPCPPRGIGVCWANGYDGLFPFDNQDHLPWEDSLMDQSNSSPAFEHATDNPYNVPGASELLNLGCQILPNSVSMMKQGEEGLTMLPWEIIETIAKLLPTGDVLSLRRCSKRFLPILTSQTFWASRFEAFRERHFFFESWNIKGPQDWRALYRATGPSTSLPGLKNRRRIWKLIGGIIHLLSLRLDDTLSSSENCGDARNYCWKEVHGDLKKGPFTRVNFHEGCRLCGKQCALIPQDLCKIAFSVFRTGDVEYVTGLRLICYNNRAICIGYISESNELSLEVTGLKGFVVAMGSRGVRALRIVSNHGLLSRWFGSPKDSPVTERLADVGSASAMEVGIDGYKLVSLAVTGPDPLHVQTTTEKGSSLRSMALWYPKVPPLDLYLNEESFTGEWPSVDIYQPLAWVRFGGENGDHLQSLKSVSVTTLGDITGIDFQYDAGNMISCKLGRRRFTDFSRVTRFAIDGPGGERIDSVEVSIERIDGERVYSFYRHGKLSTLKLVTNRGRSIHFGLAPEASTTPTTHPSKVASGTTITGFYGSQHPECGLISLGVISEIVS